MTHGIPHNIESYSLSYTIKWQNEADDEVLKGKKANQPNKIQKTKTTNSQTQKQKHKTNSKQKKKLPNKHNYESCNIFCFGGK